MIGPRLATGARTCRRAAYLRATTQHKHQSRWLASKVRGPGQGENAMADARPNLMPPAQLASDRMAGQGRRLAAARGGAVP